jgi:DNA-binding LacI/PurR family transcriptional regulator
MGKTHTIGVVIPFFTIASQTERLRGVMSVIAESDYYSGLFAVETVPQRNKILQTIPRRGRIDGLLIFSLDPTEDDLRRIRQESISTVLVEAYHPDLHSIYLDDISAAQNAVEYLISLGHCKIAYISEPWGDPFGSPFMLNRYTGYCRALETAGIEPEPAYHAQGAMSREGGRQMGLYLFSLPVPPTAIFAFSDVQALGAIEAARELNRSVPGDLSVAGYDDIDLAYYAQLTTVRQQLFESGVQGVELLLKAIEEPEMPLVHRQLATELVIRQTTAPPRK